MLDPPPIIEFLKLRACLVRIKGRHALKWGMCSYSNTEQQYSIESRQRTSVGFKLVVRGDTAWSRWLGSATTVYSILRQGSYIAWLFLATASVGARPSPFVLVSQTSLT